MSAPFDNPYYGENGVLKNKLGIADRAELRSIEYEVATARDSKLQVAPISGRYDFEHLSAIHKAMFDPVFEWAGQPREINFSKKIESRPGWKCVFAPKEEIRQRMDALADRLEQQNHLKDLPPKEFALAIADVYKELNYIHPFPEGNGRSTKAFLRQLANEAGYEMNYDRVNASEWNTAAADSQVLTNIRESNLKTPPHLAPLQRVFEKIAEPLMPRQKEELGDTRQRLIVMNGQCVAQSFDEASNKWQDGKIEKAAQRPAGIYNLYSATPADSSKAVDGLIVHVDARNVFQQVGKSLVKHPVENFDKVPEIGVAKSISYNDGKAIAAPSLGKGRSRGI